MFHQGAIYILETKVKNHFGQIYLSRCIHRVVPYAPFGIKDTSKRNALRNLFANWKCWSIPCAPIFMRSRLNSNNFAIPKYNAKFYDFEQLPFQSHLRHLLLHIFGYSPFCSLCLSLVRSITRFSITKQFHTQCPRKNVPTKQQTTLFSSI